MSTYLSAEVQEGLRKAQDKAMRQSTRLSVHVGEDAHRIDELRPTGFSIAKERDPKLRGTVDIYDGPKHLFHALIIYSELDGDMMAYEFKQIRQALDQAPADFVRESDAPIALLR